MISLLKVDSKKFFGKIVVGQKTGPYRIDNIKDLSEFLALEHDVVTVPNGDEHLRVANALAPENHKDGVGKLGAGLTKVKDAPKISQQHQQIIDLTTAWFETNPEATQDLTIEGGELFDLSLEHYDLVA